MAEPRVEQNPGTARQAVDKAESVVSSALQSRATRRVALFGGLRWAAAGALLLAGCGGGGGSEASSAADSSPTPIPVEKLVFTPEEQQYFTKGVTKIEDTVAVANQFIAPAFKDGFNPRSFFPNHQSLDIASKTDRDFVNKWVYEHEDYGVTHYKVGKDGVVDYSVSNTYDKEGKVRSTFISVVPISLSQFYEVQKKLPKEIAVLLSVGSRYIEGAKPPNDKEGFLRVQPENLRVYAEALLNLPPDLTWERVAPGLPDNNKYAPKTSVQAKFTWNGRKATVTVDSEGASPTVHITELPEAKPKVTPTQTATPLPDNFRGR